MVRKALVVVLTALAVATFMCGLASLFEPIGWGHWWKNEPPFGWIGFQFPYVGMMHVRVATSVDGGKPQYDIEFAGFQLRRNLGRIPKPGYPVAVNVRRFEVAIPLYGPLVLFSAYPTIAFIRGPLRRYRRRRKGLCLRCGYDLTGNVTGVCSECGQATAASAPE